MKEAVSGFGAQENHGKNNGSASLGICNLCSEKETRRKKRFTILFNYYTGQNGKIWSRDGKNQYFP